MIVPQAVRIVIPPVTNDFIALFKDTSVCSMIAVAELTGMYRFLFQSHPRLMLEFGLMTALLVPGDELPAVARGAADGNAVQEACTTETDAQGRTVRDCMTHEITSEVICCSDPAS